MNNTRMTKLLTASAILLACVIVLFLPVFFKCNLQWNEPEIKALQPQQNNTLQQNDTITQQGSVQKETGRYYKCFSLKQCIPDHIDFSFQNGIDLRKTDVYAKILMCAIALGLFMICFPLICPDIRKRRQIGAMGTIVIITLFLMKILDIWFFDYPVLLNSHYFIFLLLALPALVITPLFGFKPAVCVGILTSVLTTILFDKPMAQFIGIVMTIAGGYFTDKLKIATYEKYFVCSIFSLLISSFLLSLCLEHCSGIGIQDYIRTGRLIFFISLSGSVFSPLLAYFLLHSFEWIFRVETSMTFMDLTNPAHKNLKEMIEKAPGTMAHCQQVAYVAETAALKIGANHLKVRACALYHDLGKLVHPEYFTENSMEPDGHTAIKDMTPEEAVKAIREHVSAGKEMMGYRFKSVKEAIASHHGTNFIGRFYKLAVEKYGTENVKEEDFRHKGPLPSNREEVILMLADSACAAVQGLPEKTPDKIEGKVNEVLNTQINLKQYNDANIKVKELLDIYYSIVETLKSQAQKRC